MAPYVIAAIGGVAAGALVRLGAWFFRAALVRRMLGLPPRSRRPRF